MLTIGGGVRRAESAQQQQAGRLYAARKQDLFPDVRRLIMSWQYRQTDGNHYLDVSSTLVG